MRTIIFVNGAVSDYGALARWVQAGDTIICADGGVTHCMALGYRPQVVVGDMDSVDPDTLHRLAADGVELERHPRHKDQTDLELALERALRDGADEVLILGALGGRLDQALANILILAQRPWPVPIAVAEGNQVASVLHGGETVTLRGSRGSTVSLIPLSNEVTGVTYGGLEYDLTDATISLGSTRAVSNVVSESPATISISTGLALIVQTL
ncbi:MAG: thiamine diphosphokinase [Caldilineaceae bacterium]